MPILIKDELLWTIRIFSLQERQLVSEVTTLI